MTPERVGEIAIALTKWNYRHMGTELYMSELKQAAKDLNIPDEEMFEFYLAIFDGMRLEMVSELKQDFSER